MTNGGLPEPAVLCDCGGNYYTADQLRAAIAQERDRAEQDAKRWRFWKDWWMNSEDEGAQLPTEVELLMNDMDLDAAMDAAIRGQAEGERG